MERTSSAVRTRRGSGRALLFSLLLLSACAKKEAGKGDDDTPSSSGECLGTACAANAKAIDWSASSPTYDAHVRVVNAAGEPVKDAVVKVGNKSAKTDKDGRAAVGPLPAVTVSTAGLADPF